MRRKDILDARQIKAARALLDWSQDDLAKITCLSVATIRKLEQGNISPRGKTNQCIRDAVESAGLEFIEPNGVRFRPDDITIHEGREGFVDFYDDVYNTSKMQGSEIVTVELSEHDFINSLGEANCQKHIERMIAIKDSVKVKCILIEDQKLLLAPDYCEYRGISRNYVDSVPFYVYGNKCAIIVFYPNGMSKVTVIHSSAVANAFRKQFYSMWDKATPLHAPPAAQSQSKRKKK